MPEQERLADPAVVAEVELGMVFFQIVVDVDDVGHRPGQRQRLFEARAGMEQDGGAADFAQHVVATRVGVHQVADDGGLIGLPEQNLLELVNPPV